MATEVRVGLMQSHAVTQERPQRSVLDVIEHKKTIRQHVKEFASIFAIIAMGFAAYAWYYQGSLFNFSAALSIAALLLVTGYTIPIVLYPLWKIWMALAMGLGFIVTTIVLFIMWVCVFIPISIALKAIGKHVMDTTFDRSVTSYWNDRDEKYHDFKLLERQF